jgi:GNAT superfamily N-acetyltransferase
VKFRVRAATPRDIDVLVEHRRNMFVEMVRPTRDQLEVLEASYRKWAPEMMRRRLLHGYIVTSGRKVVASGCVWLRDVQPSPGRPAGKVPYLLSVYTVPELRRNGLASMIVKEAMEWSRKKGYHKMVLHASRTGRKVYSKLGWERTWEMEYYFED